MPGRVGPGREHLARRLPGVVVGLELGAQVGRGEAREGGDPLGVLVGGLGGVVSGDAAEQVLGAGQVSRVLGGGRGGKGRRATGGRRR